MNPFTTPVPLVKFVKKKKKKTRQEKNSKGYWKDEADKWMSRWVRKSNANFQGKCQCVTCGKWLDWEEMQNGHYESRGTHILRYDLRNGHPQCVGCNIFKNGNMAAYALYMIRTYGQEILFEFEELSKKIIQRSWKDYKEIADKFKEMFDKL